MAESPPVSPISPPGRPRKAATRVLRAAEYFEQPLETSRLDNQQQVNQHDLDKLLAAKRVGNTRPNYVCEPSTPSPTRHSRTNSSLTPVSDSPSFGSHPPAADSPATQLASQLANMSLRDPGERPEGGGGDGENKKGFFRGLGQTSVDKSPKPGGSRTGDPVPPPQNGTAHESKLATRGADTNGVDGKSHLGGVGNGCASRTEPTTKTLRHASSKDELALLVVSSGITELSMSIQEVNTLIFEIQELRHTTAPVAPAPTQRNGPASSSPMRRPSDHNLSSSASNAPSEASFSPSMASNDAPSSSRATSREPSALSEVDAALMRLDAKLEIVAKEFADIEAQIAPFFSGSPSSPGLDDDTKSQAAFLRRKWTTTIAEWETTQKDADILGEELKEDKWLVVFRTVSQQAEEMMRSLEKVLTQSHQFVWDLNRRKAKSSGTSSSSVVDPSRFPPEAARTPGGHAFGSETVSGGGPSYFGDPTTLQPLLSSFVALHRSLHSKVKYYAPACDRVLKILGKGIADRSTKNGEVLRRFAEMKSRWRNLLDRIGRIEAEMNGVEEMLREVAGPVAEDATPAGSLSPPRDTGADGSIGRMSPFRRFANKISSRSSPNSTPTSSSTPPRPPRITPTSSPAAPPRASTASGMYGTLQTPPRPPKSDKRLVIGAGPGSSAGTPPRPPMSTMTSLSHRRSASAMNLAVPGSGSSPGMGGRPPRRAPSPAPSADGLNKPRWNISTKRGDERETVHYGGLGGGRPSLAGTLTPSRSVTPSAQSGRTSAMGLRSTSRMSNTLARSFYGGGSARPVSPTFSDASSTFVRDRPVTPSRIPVPASAGRYRSTTPFSSLEDNEPSSLLQRAMSPTPMPSLTSPYRPLHAATASRGASRTRLPTPGGLSPPRAPSPSLSKYYRGQTPEPNLMAQAQRMAHVRAPHSRPPAVPAVPANLRDANATPRAGARRLSTSLSARTDGVTSPIPNSGPSTSAPYTPNSIDPLDVAVAKIVNALPILLHVERLDPPLTRVQVAQAEVLSARYFLSMGSLEQKRAIMCKLVDRVGPRAAKGEKKVLVRVGSGWQDLDSYGMSLLATSV